MTNIFAKKKQKNEVKPDYMAPENLVTIKPDKEKMLEKLLNDISGHSFISTSPITGEMVDVVRTEDIEGILRTFLEMDEE